MNEEHSDGKPGILPFGWDRPQPELTFSELIELSGLSPERVRQALGKKETESTSEYPAD